MAVPNGPVFPVLPSYTESGELDVFQVQNYVRYLEAEGASTVMTTAGTSQFNLMTPGEISRLNSCVARTFKKRFIAGAPPLSELHLIRFLREAASEQLETDALIIYPERFYSPNEVVRFFCKLAEEFPTGRFFIHGLAMRNGAGGAVEFSGDLIRRIIDCVPQVVGMKEECSTYEGGFDLCASISANPNFELIVAGGSMRRYHLLRTAGAQRFLAGVGSLFPSIEISFAEHLLGGRAPEAVKIMTEIETPVFRVFMAIGWHKAIRFAAKRLGLVRGPERGPMVDPTASDANRIDETLAILQRRFDEFKKMAIVT